MSLGLVSGRPTYDQLCEASHGRRRNYLVMLPTTPVEDWSAFAGSTYVTAFEKLYRNLRRDVVAVLVLDHAPLARVESIAACEATPYSYFYDPDQEFEHPGFVWDSSYFDIGVLGGTDPETSHYWDQFPQLYVNLDGQNPNSTSVLAALGFFIGQEGIVEPTMGEDLFAGEGSFENWS